MAVYKLPSTVSPRLIGSAFVILVACIEILASAVSDFDSDSDILLFHRDYTPPAPPPPPPHPPSLSCEHIGGVGSLDTTCEIVSDLNLSENVYAAGRGNFAIARNVRVSCSSFLGCELSINITGNFTLGENSSIICGTFHVIADSASLGSGSTVNTTSLGGTPPPQTSGTPQGTGGGGGGHGGRGAACSTDKTKLPEDVWGGDAYSWSSLKEPWNYGSRGGTTSMEFDYGGGGGGRVMFEVSRLLEVNGIILADGGDGGARGGGGSGGSIYIKAKKM